MLSEAREFVQKSKAQRRNLVDAQAQSFVVGTRECTCVCLRFTRSLVGQDLLLGCLALGDDEVHLCMNGEADDFLVEWLR